MNNWDAILGSRRVSVKAPNDFVVYSTPSTLPNILE
jgi:hypothetical protein